MTAPTFTAYVASQVPPLAIGAKLLWDRAALDRWIDHRQAGGAQPDDPTDMAVAMYGDPPAWPKRR